jgi:phage gp29-like protein
VTVAPLPLEMKPPRGRLENEVGAPMTGKINTPWREWNELGLTPQRLLLILNQARRGEADQLLDLSERLLERDGHLRSVLQTRLRAIDKVPTAVVPVSKDAADQKLADFVQTELVDKPNFRQLRAALTDAIFKGYSVVEIIWDTSDTSIWRPRYQWRWPQFFAWDRETGTQLRLKTEQSPVDGEELEPFKWICHAPQAKQGLVVRSGLVWPVSMLTLFKSMDARYWMALAEVHGMPWRVAKTKAGATEEDKLTALQTIIDLGHDAAVVLPDGVELELKEAAAATGKSDFHEKIVRWFNQEISKVVLGQTMTTEDGSSLAQAKVHDVVREDIRDADLVDLDDTLTAQLVTAFVRMNVSTDIDDAEIPQLQSVSKRPEDAKAAAEALRSLYEAKGKVVPRVPSWQVLEKIGYTAPEKGDLLLDGTVFDPAAPEPVPPPADDPADEDPADPEDD